MALTFNGVSDKLLWTGDITSGTLFPFSLFCWIKPAGESWYGAVGGVGDSVTGSSLTITSGAVTQKIQAWDRDNTPLAVSATATTIIDTGAWQPCLAVFTSASSRSIYYGPGAVVTDTTVQGAHAAPARFVLGFLGHTDTHPYWGDLAEVATWSSALGQTDFNTLSGDVHPETVQSGTLISSWTLLTQANSHNAQAGTARTLTATGTTQAASHPITRTGGAATAITLSGPSSGGVNAASTNFTVGANGTITGTPTVTPTDSSGNGSFTPTTVSISSGTPTATFTYTPTTVGSRNINCTNNGSLTAPANIAYSSTGASCTITVVTSPTDLTPRANLSGFKGRWFDNATPNYSGAPVNTFTNLSTNASGVMVVSMPNSALTSGQVGWLFFSNSDGTPGQTPAEIAFSGPVAVT